MIESRSTKVPKSTINQQTKQRLFGGIPPTYPDGSPLLLLLDALDEKQLYLLNLKLCALYAKNLTAMHHLQDHKTIIDVDPRIRKRRPIVKSDAKPPHEGPPLRRRPGHFLFKDAPLKPVKPR